MYFKLQLYNSFFSDEIYKSDPSYSFMETYLKFIDYDYSDNTLDPEHYVSHPVS